MIKKNILIVSNLYPNPLETNRGIFVESLVRELRNNCDVAVLCPLPWFPKSGLLKKFRSWHKFALIGGKYCINGQDVLCVKYIAFPKLGFSHAVAVFLGIFFEMRKLIKSKSIDVVNAHWLFPDGVAACLAGVILRVPVVLTAHGTDINMYLSMPLRKMQIIWALKTCDAITVVSSKHKEKLEQAGIEKDKIQVIGNGFNSNFALMDKKECRQKLGLGIEKKIALFVGRIVEVKGLGLLIEAVKHLGVEFKKEWEVFIVGDGKLKNYYMEMVKRYKLESQISFFGEKPHDQIPCWLGACDMLILSSISEGCPTALIEALACGRPVISSAVGEVPNLIHEGKNGFLFNSGDVRGLGNAIVKGYETSWDEAEITASVKDMSWKNISEKYLEIYNKAGLIYGKIS
ncbi:MAG: glycosyltransferase family 4 protein [Candidatus Omnitrophica bacterium]|nr:glycosyltransferase family 4 protein [Candidatus Omnitrophota bacterium]